MILGFLKGKSSELANIMFEDKNTYSLQTKIHVQNICSSVVYISLITVDCNVLLAYIQIFF